MKKLLLIDGHNLLFRMYYGIPAPIMNHKGRDIRGVLGFIGGLLKVVKSGSFDEMMIVFDSESSTASKVESNSDYKANRVDYSQVPDEDNPFVQLDYIYPALNYMNIPFIEVQNYEADDYIASLVAKYKDDRHITIVSTDRDFLQLVCDSVEVYSPRGKLSINFTPEKVYEKFNVHPHQIIDYKVLVGDSSDNIKGIKSIGPKTAVKILSKGSIKSILEGKVIIEEKIKRKLLENRELIENYWNLITMISNIEIEERDLSIKFDRDISTMNVLEACDIR